MSTQIVFPNITVVPSLRKRALQTTNGTHCYNQILNSYISHYIVKLEICPKIVRLVIRSPEGLCTI